jgi:exonuclease SbcC
VDGEGRIQRMLASTVQSVDTEIEKLLKLDYRTFLYTLLIRQGEVAGIIGRSVSPSQRREIFMRAFNAYFEKQKEEARRLRDLYYMKIERLKTDISRIQIYISQLGDLKNLLESIELELNSSLEEASNLRAELDEIEKNIRRSEEMRSLLNRELGKLEAEHSKLRDLTEKLNELKSRKEYFAQNWERYPFLKSDLDKLKSRIDILEKLRSMVTDYEMLKSKASSLETTVRISLSMKRRLEELKNSYDALSRRIKLLEKVEEEKNKVMEDIDKVRSDIVSLEERLKFSTASFVELSKSDVCPVCGSKLAESVRDSLQKRFADEVDKLKRVIDDKKLILDVLRERIRECEARIAILAQARGAIKPIEEEMEKIRSELDRLTASEEEYTKVKSSLLSIESELRSVLGSIYSGLDEFDRRLEELRSAYRSLDEEIKRLEYIQSIVNDLDKEIAKLECDVACISRVEKDIDDVKKKIIDMDSSIKDMLKRRSEINSKLELCIKKCEELKSRKKNVEDKIQESARLSEELSRLEAELKDASYKYNTYRILYEKVFHDKGFPMYLLQDIISSVEYWSRIYLSKLLPGIDLKMDISREGDISIKIYSDGVERELSTYSGGEATLIGFAIRLGIAKTLAEKKGVKSFRMLIIDEGFGPLSDEFRTRLLEVLKEFSVDYEKIIVISHIEDIQNSPVFTDAIYVSRDSSGRSHIAITSCT